MKFSIHRSTDDPKRSFGPFIEACFSRTPDDPLYEEQGPTQGSGLHDTKRLLASAHGETKTISLWMQHLQMSKSQALLPGREIEVTLDEFSQIVDHLVQLRNDLRDAWLVDTAAED